MNIVDIIIMLTTVGVVSLCYINMEAQYGMLVVAAPMLMVYLSVRLFSVITPRRLPIVFLLLLVIIMK